MVKTTVAQTAKVQEFRTLPRRVSPPSNQASQRINHVLSTWDKRRSSERESHSVSGRLTVTKTPNQTLYLARPACRLAFRDNQLSEEVREPRRGDVRTEPVPSTLSARGPPSRDNLQSGRLSSDSGLQQILCQCSTRLTVLQLRSLGPHRFTRDWGCCCDGRTPVSFSGIGSDPMAVE